MNKIEDFNTGDTIRLTTKGGTVIQGRVLGQCEGVYEGQLLWVEGLSAIFLDSLESIEVIERAPEKREPGLYVVCGANIPFRGDLTDAHTLARWDGERWELVEGIPGTLEIQKNVSSGVWKAYRVVAREQG